MCIGVLGVTVLLLLATIGVMLLRRNQARVFNKQQQQQKSPFSSHLMRQQQQQGDVSVPLKLYEDEDVDLVPLQQLAASAIYQEPNNHAYR